MHTPAPASPFVRLKASELTERAERDGLTSPAEIASRLGVHRLTVWRLLRNDMAPGNSFIAAVLHSFGGRFEDFFEVSCDVAAKGRAA